MDVSGPWSFLFVLAEATGAKVGIVRLCRTATDQPPRSRSSDVRRQELTCFRATCDPCSYVG
jgi:hypothetical protein